MSCGLIGLDLTIYLPPSTTTTLRHRCLSGRPPFWPPNQSFSTHTEPTQSFLFDCFHSPPLLIRPQLHGSVNSCYGPEGLGVHCCFLVEFSSLAAHLTGCFSCMLLSWESCLAPVWDTPSFKQSSAPDGPPFFILTPSKALLCLLAYCLCVLTWMALSSMVVVGGSITVPTVSARPVVVLASTQQAFRTYELNDEGNKP